MASKPPPSTAAGVPSGGNGTYIAVAVILLLLLGGAIIYKLTQKQPDTIVEKLDAGPPVVPSGRKTTDDDIPLPPEVPDAGPDAGKKVDTARNGGDTGCAVKCSGSTTPELEASLSMRARQAHSCYDAALASDATLKGKVAIALKIGAGGQVCSAGVASSDLASPNVATCMANKYRGNSFPPPKGGCVDINVPVNLQPPK